MTYKPYKHTQTGWVVWATFVGVVVLVFVLPTAPDRIWFAQPLICFILLFAAAMMASLTVEVDDRLVRVRFGVGIIHKSFRLDDIESCQIVRNKWWYGWGIRSMPGGWIYNVSGLNAVELVLKNGRKFRIGTDQPRVLSEIIQARLTIEP